MSATERGWPQGNLLLKAIDEALRGDAELDADPAQAMTLRDLDRHIKPA
jgi:hypothetical protein